MTQRKTKKEGSSQSLTECTEFSSQVVSLPSVDPEDTVIKTEFLAPGV